MASTGGGSGIGEAIVVLDAGSSSLKFSVYRIRDEDLVLVARGQVEGLGATPRFKARDKRGRVLADADIGRTAGHSEAFSYLVHWVGEQFNEAFFPVAGGASGLGGGVVVWRAPFVYQGGSGKMEEMISPAPPRETGQFRTPRAVR